MHLIQILLPRRDNEGNDFPPELYRQIAKDLTAKFGGVTLYERAPAKGLWEGSDGEVVQDDIVVVEVMSERLGREWWRRYGRSLERWLRQEKLVVRAQKVALLGR